MTHPAYLKPVPERTHESKPYWDGLMQGQLLVQKCAQCGKLRHYPRPVCDRCFSFDVKWIKASGRGSVHSWTIAHHAFNPGFKDELPYALVTVDLVEGVRMLAPLRGVNFGEIRIGLPVRISFESPDSDLTLPAFVGDPSAAAAG